MKKEKKLSLRALDTTQMHARLLEIAKQIVDLKMKLHTGALKNTREMGFLKQERAVIKTILHERELAAKSIK